MSEDEDRNWLTILTERKRSYQLVFNTPPGKEVLRDLIPFCRANETCAVPGDRDRTFALEGRREVWLRIQEHLTLEPEELFKRYTRPAKQER